MPRNSVTFDFLYKVHCVDSELRVLLNSKNFFVSRKYLYVRYEYFIYTYYEEGKRKKKGLLWFDGPLSMSDPREVMHFRIS